MIKFKRKCELYLHNADEALDLSQLRVSFEIHQATQQTPNWAVIRVYNISKDTVNRAQDEFDKIDLRVGYGNETARLFYGLIRQYNYGLRADARDTFIDFVCSDGDIAFNQAYVSLTIAAGWTQKDQALLAVDSLIEYGVTRGYIGDLPTRPMPRGKAIFGGTRYVLNNLMTNAGADWSIKNGQAEIRPQDELPPGVAIKLTPGTGLIGLPQQTVDGITLKALIDARFEYGSLIEVDNSTIQGANLPVEYTATPFIPSYDASGVYKIYSVNHTGDTRGNEWYSELLCVSATGGNVPEGGTYLSAVPKDRQE